MDGVNGPRTISLVLEAGHPGSPTTGEIRGQLLVWLGMKALKGTLPHRLFPKFPMNPASPNGGPLKIFTLR